MLSNLKKITKLEMFSMDIKNMTKEELKQILVRDEVLYISRLGVKKLRIYDARNNRLINEFNLNDNFICKFWENSLLVTTNRTNRLYDVNINTLSVDNGKFYFNAYDLVFGWLIFEFI